MLKPSSAGLFCQTYASLRRHRRRIARMIAALLSSALLAACSNFGFPGVYRIDIPQGNIVEEESVAQLQLGMTKEQVRYVMGPPVLHDTFEPSYWHYLYHLRQGKDDTIIEKRLTLRFEGNLLADISEEKQQQKQDKL